MENTPRRQAVGITGAAPQVTWQNGERRTSPSEAQLDSFAEHSTNLIWIGEAAADDIVYLSPAFERIWGLPQEQAPASMPELLRHVHADDRHQTLPLRR